MISPVVPNPAGAGVERRAAAHVKALARDCVVSLVIFRVATGDGEIPEGIRTACSSVAVVPVDHGTRSTQGGRFPGLTMLEELLSPDRSWVLPDVGRLAAAVDGFAVARFDICFCFRLRSALALRRLERVRGSLATRYVVDFDDIESTALARTGQSLAQRIGREWRAIYALRARRARQAEDRMLRRFDIAMVCSDDDRDRLLARDARASVVVVPNSVQPVDIAPRQSAAGPVNMLFVGTMSYPPNTDAVLWFCKAVLPAIRAGCAAACRLAIVGFDPPAQVVALGEADNIEVTGGVDSVVPYYEDADIVVAPIRFGGGTRIKILEAMGMRRPVVATTLGAEGIACRHEREVLIADSAEDFAAACLRLIRDPDLRTRLATAGRELVERSYTQAAIDAAVDDMLNALDARA